MKMKPRSWILAPAALVGMAAAGYWLALPPPQAVAPPVDRSSPRFIAEDLGDPDPAISAAARRRLAALPIERRKELSVAAEQADVPEVRQLLLGRLADIDAALALLPPAPISLHVKGATISELAAKLGAATDCELVGGPAGSEGTYTLDADNKPFWEVFAALDAQIPLTVRGANGKLELLSGTGMAGKQIAIQGPFVVYGMRGNLTVAADPRVIALGIDFTYACYDKDGKELRAAGGAPIPVRYLPNMPTLDPAGFMPMRSHNTALITLDLSSIQMQNPGQPIATVKVRGRIACAARLARLDIPDPASHVGEKFTAGRTSVTLSSIRIFPSSYSLALSASSNAGPEWFTFRILDGNNTICFGGTNVGIFGGGGGGGIAATGPFTLQVNAVQEVKLTDVQFELKQPS